MLLLLDHLVGAQQQRLWDGQAEHPRGLNVDGELSRLKTA
jgi:hypothetical protein